MIHIIIVVWRCTSCSVVRYSKVVSHFSLTSEYKYYSYSHLTRCHKYINRFVFIPTLGATLHCNQGLVHNLCSCACENSYTYNVVERQTFGDYHCFYHKQNNIIYLFFICITCVQY